MRFPEPRTCYDLLVVAADVGDAVVSVGAWMCDRVRAGWRVTALVGSEDDAVPLTVLGVRIALLEDDLVWVPFPAAVAFSLGEWATTTRRLRVRLDEAMCKRGAEITVWGDGEIGSDRRFDDVQHRPSAAADAFRRQATVLAGVTASVAGCERLRSSSVWYSLADGDDLTIVAP